MSKTPKVCERCCGAKKAHYEEPFLCSAYAVPFVPKGTRHDTARYQMTREDAEALCCVPTKFYAPGIKMIIEEVLREQNP